MAWNMYDPRQQADINRVLSGNWLQKIAGGLGQIASGVGINRDFGVSELFGSPKARPAKSPIPEWQKLGYSSEAEYNADRNANSGGQTYTPVTSTPSYSSQTSSQAPSFAQSFGGKMYTDLLAYTNAVNESAQKEYETQRSLIDKAYQSGLLSYDDRNTAIEQNRKNIQTQRESLLRDYNQNVESLGEQKKSSLEGQAGFFSAIAPDWTQSEQGVLAEKTGKEYQKGMENLDYTKGLNEQSINQALGDLSTYQTATGREKQAYTDSYNENLRQLESARQQQIDSTINQYLSNLASGAYANNLNKMSQAQTITPQTSGYNIMPFLQQIASYLPQYGKSATGSNVAAYTTPTNSNLSAYEQYLAGLGYGG